MEKKPRSEISIGLNTLKVLQDIALRNQNCPEKFYFRNWPEKFYFGLSLTVPNADGSNVAEPSSPEYHRVDIKEGTHISLDKFSCAEPIRAAVVYDAPIGGNMFYFFTFHVPSIVNPGDTLVFPKSLFTDVKEEKEDSGDEEEIIALLSDRLSTGRKTYGPWKIDDGRNYTKEALEEVLDALHYCAAALLKMKSQDEKIEAVERD